MRAFAWLTLTPTWLAPVIQTTLSLNAAFGSCLDPSSLRSASALTCMQQRSNATLLDCSDASRSPKGG